MALTTRQKKIVNPYAKSAEKGYNTASRNGVDYDYDNMMNRYIIDIIQENYLSFHAFTESGKMISNGPEDRIINTQDLLAYAALYPQNAKVSTDELVHLSDQEAKNELAKIARNLESENVLDKYSTVTPETLFFSKDDESEEKKVAALVAIPEQHSRPYKRKLRSAIDSASGNTTDEIESSLEMPPEISTYVGSDTNVDLYDWRKNCVPGMEKQRVYYNPSDKNFYFVKRATSALPQQRNAFQVLNKLRIDARTQTQAARRVSWGRLTDPIKNVYFETVDDAITEILKITGKYSDENLQSLKRNPPQGIGAPPEHYCAYTYKDPRPGSAWAYAVKIPGSLIQVLPDVVDESGIRPSYEEFEISAYSKSRRLIGEENNSRIRFSFRILDLLVYVRSSTTLMREYSEILFEEGITPSLISNVDLEQQAQLLNSFMDYLSLFYGYNKIVLNDEDQIEFFLTDQYVLDHICINGKFYYQGCGNVTYNNFDDELTRALNAFAVFNPTTFSLIESSPIAYDQITLASPESRMPPVEYIQTYLYPKITLDAIEASNRQKEETNNNTLQKKKIIFETLKRLTSQDGVALQRRFGERHPYYAVTSTLGEINCGTGQAQLLQNVLPVWGAIIGKVKVQSLVKQLIILLRDELVDDALTAELVTKGAEYTANPSLFRLEVENFVNQQIFCSLDAVGDFVERSFLDPIGSPPPARTLIRKSLDKPIKVKIPTYKMVSIQSRQSDYYEKMFKIVLENYWKSVVASVVKDFVAAILGCAPEAPDNTLPTRLKNFDYGLVNLKSAAGEVDIVRLAKSVNLVNESLEQGEVQMTDPTRDQLLQFVSDVSNMSTPLELDQLLDGDASNEYLQHLLEVLESEQNVVFFRTVKNIEGTNRVRNLLEPSEYPNFVFTEQKLIDFFVKLGDVIDGVNIDIGDISSPLDAYCNSKESPLDGLNLDLSDLTKEQIAAQYADIAQDKLNKINYLCDWLRGLENIEIELKRLLDIFPVLEYYNNLLREIAKLSNLISEKVAAGLSKIFEDRPKNTASGKYNLYHSKVGSELFYQIFFALRNIPMSTSYSVTQENGYVSYYVCPPGPGTSPSKAAEGSAYTVAGATQTLDAVIKHIFSFREINPETGNYFDVQDPDGANVNVTGIPKRLRLPQYTSVAQNPLDTIDAAYYSYRNAPGPLASKLDTAQFAEVVNEDGARGDNTRAFLQTQSREVFNYLLEEQNSAPYVGYTGHSWLRVTHPSNGGVSLYMNRPLGNGNLDLVARWMPSQGSTYRREGDSGFAFYVNYYRTIQRLDRGNYYISGGSKLPHVGHPEIKTLFGNLSIGKTSYDTTSPSTAEEQKQNKFMAVVNNWYRRTDTLIDDSVTGDVGRRRMPRYLAATNRNPLKVSDDPCITAEEEAKATTAVDVLQSRMQRFFLNVMPLASAYGSWGSNGTTAAISDYLVRKIRAELKERQILGTMYGSLDFIKKVFPNTEEEEFSNNPVISEDNSPDINLKNVISSLYLGILREISVSSEYADLDKNIFENDTLIDNKSIFSRYAQTVDVFLSEITDQLADPNGLRYGVPDADVNAVRSVLDSCFGGPQTIPFTSGLNAAGLEFGTYYMPIALMIANYLIYYDQGIKYSERYSDIYYRTEVNIANADDSLLSAFQEHMVNRFSNLYVGFPVPVPFWDGDREPTYYNQIQVSRRIVEVDRDIENGIINSVLNEFLRWSPPQGDAENIFAWENKRYIGPTNIDGESLNLIRNVASNPFVQRWYGENIPNETERLIQERAIRRLAYTATPIDIRVFQGGGGINHPAYRNDLGEGGEYQERNPFSFLGEMHLLFTSATFRQSFREESWRFARNGDGTGQSRANRVVNLVEEFLRYPVIFGQDEGSWISLRPDATTSSEYFRLLSEIFQQYFELYDGFTAGIADSLERYDHDQDDPADETRAGLALPLAIGDVLAHQVIGVIANTYARVNVLNTNMLNEKSILDKLIITADTDNE